MFIGRKRELASLDRLYASNKFEFTVIYGRRRVGKTALINQFIKDKKAIFEEPENLLKQEVREPALYNAIITAVATGASRMAEISAKVGEDTSVCASYLKNLVTLGLVRKETPYGEKASRKSIYAIADNMFRFWYRFVPENHSIIARGAADVAYKRIEPYMPDYMGKVFEDICGQYLWKLLLEGKSPIAFKDLGRWWGTDPSTRSQTEIDIMGEQDKDHALFAECKWTNDNVDVGVLEKLIKRSQLFHYNHAHLYLFAKNGFTKVCIDQASAMGNVTLVTYNDILKNL
ncbi:ATP-binding protein [Clostridiales bacterium]|nr:ATP-binding protein [Clostridiales bacterium]